MAIFSDLSKICVSENTPIRQTISCINREGVGIVLVVDEKLHLLGTVTDGDVRRAMLAGLDLGLPTQKLLEQKVGFPLEKPIFALDDITLNEALRVMQEHMIRHIPIVDNKHHLVDLILLEDLLPSRKGGMQAVVMAGGQTMRLHPLAVDLPKPMLPVGNRPLLEFTIEQLRQAGFNQVILTTHYKADSVVKHFGDGHDFGVDITYNNESEPFGTAGALRNLEISNTPLLVVNGDVLTGVNFGSMLAYHQEHQADITVAVRLNEFRVPYGVIETENGQVASINEVSSVEYFINAGAYLLNPDALSFIPDAQHYDMVELINKMIQLGKRVISFPIHEYWRDIQVYEDYQQAVTDVRNGVFSDQGLTIAGLEPGTPPPDGFIPLCVPEIQGNEWAYIKECLDTNWVSSVGPFVTRFGETVADYVGSKFGVATSTGTAAIHIALLVAGVQPDDEVLISDLTFIAPANAVRYINAWPVFIDVEPDYWQMDPQKLAAFLKEKCHWVDGKLYNRISGRRVRAIIPVHILGHSCDMDPILELARQYHLTVIEDATESLGAKYKGKMVGTLGDIACFSFNGNKIITTGGGGMIVTDNEEWAKRAKYLTTQAKDDPVEFIHGTVGFNYRLTNIQAAMGCAQMEQLDQYVQKKREIAHLYQKGLEDTPGIQVMDEADWAYSTYWLYTVLINPKEYGMDRRKLLSYLGENGIQARPLWQPLHLSPAFNLAMDHSFETAEFLQENAISLPCSVGLSGSEQEKVIKILRNPKY